MIRRGVRLRRTDDPERWAGAARLSGHPVTAFHSFSWLNVAAAMTDQTFVPLVVEVDGADIGTATWLERRRGPVVKVNAVPFLYAGPLVPDEHLDATLRALRRRAYRRRVVWQQHQLPPGVTARSGFAAEVAQTYVLDTSAGEDALWADLSSTYRKTLRRNERDGIAVVESAEAPETLARVMAAVLARQGVESGYNDQYPPRRSVLEQHGLEVHWTVAKLAGVHLGSLVTMRYEDTALLWSGGVFPEHQHQGSAANVSLYWDAMCWAARRGVATLDLVGLPNAGITTFKSRFGGALTDYAIITMPMPGLMKLRAIRNRRGQD